MIVRVFPKKPFPSNWGILGNAGQKGEGQYFPVRVNCFLEFLLQATLKPVNIALQSFDRNLELFLITPQNDCSVAGQVDKVRFYDELLEPCHSIARKVTVLVDQLKRTPQQLLRFGILGKPHKIRRYSHPFTREEQTMQFELNKLESCVEYSDLSRQVELYRRVCI